MLGAWESREKLRRVEMGLGWGAKFRNPPLSISRLFLLLERKRKVSSHQNEFERKCLYPRGCLWLVSGSLGLSATGGGYGAFFLLPLPLYLFLLFFILFKSLIILIINWKPFIQHISFPLIQLHVFEVYGLSWIIFFYINFQIPYFHSLNMFLTLFFFFLNNNQT